MENKRNQLFERDYLLNQLFIHRIAELEQVVGVRNVGFDVLA
jgi:hypothetical protein